MSRVLGIGLRREATAEALAQAIADAGPVDLLAVLGDKGAHPALTAQGIPLRLLPRAALRGVQTPTVSSRIMNAFGTGSVAEALALGAAGVGAQILSPRRVSPCGTITTALAGSPDAGAKEEDHP
ncbi:cobalamin biosynthesis protein [Thioclava sp. GXIMD2076]|uniref:cobalamin biosynthesis protein n=1 Tax=Thioclava sp. GXIMD2076 TaxID=3131931 RepID=UPI0030D56361